MVEGGRVVSDEASGRTRGLLWLVLAGVAWGTSGTLGTLLSRQGDVSFLSVAGLRIFVAGVLVLGFAVARRALVLPRVRNGWLQVGAVGVASAVYQVSFFSAVGWIGVPLATMVAIGSAPVMVAAVDLVQRRVRASLTLVASMLMAVVGLVLLVGAPPEVAPGMLLPGVVGSLLAGASFAAISLIGSRRVPDFDAVTGTGLAFLGGGLIVLLVAALVGGASAVLPTPSWPVALLVLGLGLIPSAVAYLAYLFGLRHHSGTTGSLVSLLEPVTAAVVAAIVLGQHLTPIGLLGAAVLLGAVALATRISH